MMDARDAAVTAAIGLTIIRLLGPLPGGAGGMALRTVGMLGVAADGRLWEEYLPDDPAAEAWRARVHGARAAGTPLDRAVEAWQEAANGVTWDLAVEEGDVRPGEDPGAAFLRLWFDAMAESYELEAEALAAAGVME
ncbi:MAG: hypothetical protein QJR08_00595 [Bacillota bacterium]|nr:hypothetical protein [Bacillota bacterium]